MASCSQDGSPISQSSEERKPRVLLGLSGSVACVKATILIKSLQDKGYEVKVVATKSALHFVSHSQLQSAITGNPVQAEDSASPASKFLHQKNVFIDQDEWDSWKAMGDDVLHIELRRWADVFLIAPLSANTLAKISNGICDNLLTSVARAWDFSASCKHALIICPSMNTAMWEHPLTRSQLETVSSFSQSEIPQIHIIDPISKRLACGDIGFGAMADVSTIVEKTAQCIQDLAL